MEEELLNYHHYLKLFLGLFAMIDPIAGLTAFAALAAPFSASDRNKMAGVTALAMF